MSLKEEQRPGNSTYKKLGVQWLIEHSTSHQHLCWLDNFMLRNPQLLVAAKGQAVKKPFFYLNFPYFPIATTQMEPFKKVVFF